MTSLAAMLGMLPLALAIGAGSELLQPLAIAVIGGLSMALALSLIVTPTVYAILRRHDSRIED
jgi:multidrug efflux pump subunit AcrB